MQFVLKALFNSEKDIRKGGVKNWVHGDSAFAVIQPYKGHVVLKPIVIKHVVFQRVERRASTQSGNLFYFVVLQRRPDRLVRCNPPGTAIEALLNGGAELNFLFSSVPFDELMCCNCGFKELQAGPAFFDNGVVKCSPYCHVPSLLI